MLVVCPTCNKPLVEIDVANDDYKYRTRRQIDGNWTTVDAWPFPVECGGCHGSGIIEAFSLIDAVGKAIEHQHRVRVPAVMDV